MKVNYLHKIGIVLDDHQMFADSFSALIESSSLFSRVITFTNQQNLLDFLKHERGGFIYLFLDYNLRESNVLPVINSITRIIEHYKIIVVSEVTNIQLINTLLHNKVDAFIGKTSGFNTIFDCIETINRNESFLCPNTKKLMQIENTKERISFTPKEIELLQLISKGYSIDKTAEITFLSKHTIINHRRNMMKKAKCKSVVELLSVAREQGIL